MHANLQLVIRIGVRTFDGTHKQNSNCNGLRLPIFLPEHENNTTRYHEYSMECVGVEPLLPKVDTSNPFIGGFVTLSDGTYTKSCNYMFESLVYLLMKPIPSKSSSCFLYMGMITKSRLQEEKKLSPLYTQF